MCSVSPLWSSSLRALTLVLLGLAVPIQVAAQAFTTPVVWRDGLLSGSQAPLVGDFDGDGKDDVLAVSVRAGAFQTLFTELTISLSEGHRFSSPRLWATLAGFGPVLVGDFDGDARDDVAMVSSSLAAPMVGGPVQVLLSQGNALVRAPQWSTSFSLGPATLIGSPVFRAGDIDGNGRDDLVLFVRDSRSGDERGDIQVMLSDGTHFLARQRWHDFLAIGGEVPHLGDVNADGRDDVVVFVRDDAPEPDRGDVRVSLSSGGDFGPWQNWHGLFCVGAEVPALGDFDGDGDDDAITFVQDTQGGSERGKVRVALSTRQRFQTWTNWLGGFATGAATPLVGDFNGDGLEDVLSVVPGSQPEPQRGDATVALADTALTGAASPLPDLAVRNLLASSHVGGVDGVYLKAVRGPVLAADDAQVVFDPASAIKAALLLHGLLEVGNVDPATGAPYRRLTDPVAVTVDQTQGGCPIYAGNFNYRTLNNAFFNMMRASDNRDTEALRRLFGAGNLSRTIEVLGMGATRWDGVIGCARNQATLQDLGRLYEAVGRGLLEAQKADFLGLPINTPLFEINPIIDGRAAQVGLPATFRDAYRAQVVNVYKGGSGTDSVEKRTVAGLMSLPICTPTGIVHQEYVYGVFVDGASAISPDPSGSGEFNLNRVVAEAFRREIWRSVDSFAAGGCVL